MSVFSQNVLQYSEFALDGKGRRPRLVGPARHPAPDRGTARRSTGRSFRNNIFNENGFISSRNVFVSCQTVFTEEDACEKDWLAVIPWITRHHCVTKIGFDVSYGYMCSYGYSATTAISDKQEKNK